MPKVKLPEVDGAALRESLDPQNETEARWLQDHSLLPTDHPMYGQPVVFHLPDGTPVSNDPNFAARQQLNLGNNFDEAVKAAATQMAEELFQRKLLEHQQGAIAVSGPNDGRATSGPVDHSPVGVPVSPAMDSGDSGGALETEEAPPYATWSKDDLKTEADIRGLSVSGTVTDLASRLEKDDKAKAEQTEEE
jgi:hypothetical protein